MAAVKPAHPLPTMITFSIGKRSTGLLSVVARIVDPGRNSADPGAGITDAGYNQGDKSFARLSCEDARTRRGRILSPPMEPGTLAKNHPGAGPPVETNFPRLESSRLGS